MEIVPKKRIVKRQVDHYNLEMIISINSIKATKFRQWATQILKQHITKGFKLNEKILQKNKAQFLQTLEDFKILASNNNF